eukprot:248616_1
MGAASSSGTDTGSPSPSPTRARPNLYHGHSLSDRENNTVYVQSLYHSKTIAFAVSPNLNETVRALKVRIWDIWGLRPEHQRLIHNGKQLDDQDTLSESSIANESTLELSSSLKGGMFTFAAKSPKKKK